MIDLHYYVPVEDLVYNCQCYYHVTVNTNIDFLIQCPGTWNINDSIQFPQS